MTTFQDLLVGVTLLAIVRIGVFGAPASRFLSVLGPDERGARPVGLCNMTVALCVLRGPRCILLTTRAGCGRKKLASAVSAHGVGAKNQQTSGGLGLAQLLQGSDPPAPLHVGLD
jgi:hypothetical protein